MKASSERLRQLAAVQDAELRAQDLEGARARFVRGATARRPRPRRAILAAAALIACGILMVWLWPSSRALTFAVGTSEGRVGAWIAAGAGEPVPLRFSDGTSVVLQPAARARVVAADDHGARVLLESGEIHASVTHTETSAWSFDAGPFDVQVTGTRFDLVWEPTEQALRVTLHEGAVVVTGACLPARRAVVAGQTLEVFCKEQRALLTEGSPRDARGPVSSAEPSAAPPAPTPPSPISATSPAAGDRLAVPSSSAAAGAPGAAPSPSTWRQLMAEQVTALCNYECSSDADCPQPQSGSVVPVCNHICSLPCDTTSQCPDGMTCHHEDHGDGPKDRQGLCRYLYLCE